MLPRVLIVDDESSICISLSLALESDYDIAWETDPIKALERIQHESFDLILLDMVIGEYNGLDILVKMRSISPRTQVIMMTAYGSIRSSVSAMTRGAFTYLTKPLDIDELKIYIDQALEFRALNDNVTYLNAQLKEHTPSNELIGTSPALRRLLQMVEKFRDVDVSVLISGESGSGKMTVAQALHDENKRKRFVMVNCAALDEESLEEEFFGCKNGGDMPGKLDYANQGTLYLANICELPAAFQAKLLRALQEKAFTPVGSREVHRFDTRVIASTNKNLRAMVEQGSFRSDLFYRINTAEIPVPPLRDRREDIPLLCDYFIRHSKTLQDKTCRITGITVEAQELLCTHDYPGNVRELANTIEYAGIVSNDELIKARDLPYRFTESVPDQDVGEKFLLGKTLQELERMAIFASYRHNSGKRKLMAAELGISERGLWNKLKEYDLQ
ncbi:MAG: sigma-54 dependent transcriptional regulator [Clostridiales bacterium]|nr:sigma-54 dependent transcriptional regulator [Clostridiales bacterium]